MATKVAEVRQQNKLHKLQLKEQRRHEEAELRLSLSEAPTDGRVVGRQIIMECWECNEKVFSREEVERALLEAVRRANANLLATYIHEFQPQGISAVAVIAESHIFIHTWPEMGFIAFDAFTCGEEAIPEEAAKVVKEIFQPRRVKIYELQRGRWP
ncbi:MAG: adenosylmethionine decarboxylase [Armatimonadota bacterium]|nr:adenosylmethionine decarboxylase [Armatimonadota bacterium]MCX7778010.1 adenosylmethionine decarboxylase [Armatimonadota bacterium]MDW8026015.1 adenosylmethionine decarboxylase [Armatimonadota bacterium]